MIIIKVRQGQGPHYWPIQIKGKTKYIGRILTQYKNKNKNKNKTKQKKTHKQKKHLLQEGIMLPWGVVKEMRTPSLVQNKGLYCRCSKPYIPAQHNSFPAQPRLVTCKG